MTTSLYTTYGDLPASKLAKEQFLKAQEIFELTCQAIKNNLKIAESEFIKNRDTARKSAKFEYFLTDPTINEHGKHYHMHKKAINPIDGDTEFYKDIEYGSFKIVNNVYISTGSGWQTRVNTGDVLSDQDIIDLDNNIVPNILINGYNS